MEDLIECFNFSVDLNFISIKEIKLIFIYKALATQIWDQSRRRIALNVVKAILMTKKVIFNLKKDWVEYRLID